MSERFSSTLRLADVNDFIAPSQGCIVSLKAATSSKHKRLEKKEKDAPAMNQTTLDPVKISLKDCLACSGCVTSAETVMLAKQSLNEFLSHMSTEEVVIVSVSPQSRASLASHFGISPSQVLKKLTAFFKSIGVAAVFDTSCSRDLVLVECCNEFMIRYKQHGSSQGGGSGALPVLSSSCPGWICYAEKTLGSYILPFISSVKSPQQAIGAIIKHYMCNKMHLTPDKIYHVTVMPCYDKKLEAVREDFGFSMEGLGRKETDSSGLTIAEVDSVLTSGEVLELLQLKSVDFVALEEAPLDRMLANIDKEGNLFGVPGSSGGYAETIFRHAAKTLFGREIKGPLEFKILRNSDFQEINLEVEGQMVLRFCLCYGFRNLQNIVRRIRAGKTDYHFVEIMACPSGCLNGGGQIKPKAGQSSRDLIQLLDRVYMQSVVEADPFENPIVKTIYEGWLVHPGSEEAKTYLHTRYHPVTRSVASQLQNW